MICYYKYDNLVRNEFVPKFGGRFLHFKIEDYVKSAIELYNN